MAKHYEQYCPVAYALERVGERWSLLIVRELLKGPKRYTDLSDALPRIGTNVLAARLKDLEAAGILTKRRLPPPNDQTMRLMSSWISRTFSGVKSFRRFSGQ